MGSNWRDGFQYDYMQPDPEPDEGPGLTWRQLTPAIGQGRGMGNCSGTITADGDRWVAYLRL
jgi:hypothetical protein